MRSIDHRFLKTALLVAGLLGLPLTAQGQFRIPPNPVAFSAAAQTQAVANTVAYNRAAFGYRPSAYGYGYAGPYGVVESPVGGYLRGSADVISASGDYAISNEQSKVIAEQAKQAKLDTRRKQFDQMRYEQANTPTVEDYREQDRLNQLRRARNDPPLTEIVAATPLNNLLKSIQRVETEQGLRGPSIPVDPDVLRHINVTDGTTIGSATLFKPESLSWPLVLEQDAFAQSRKDIEGLISEGVLQVTSKGKVDAKTQQQLIKAIDQVKSKLDAMIHDLTPDEYIGGTRFARQLRDTARMFNNPNAANFFNGKWEARGSTVGEVITEMTRKGLRFGPAAEGSEAAYQSFFRSLLNYDAALAQLAGH
jgi:hypothetical protein